MKALKTKTTFKKKKGGRGQTNFKITKTKLSSNTSRDSLASSLSPIKTSNKGGLQFGTLKRKEEELAANEIN